MIRPLLLCSALLAGLFATGCSSRLPSKDYILTVTSTQEDVEYTLAGTIDVDGVKTQVAGATTPYRFVAKGVALNATITSHDPDCHLKGSIDSTGLRDLTSTTVGPAGAVVTVEMLVVDRDMSLQIAVKPLKAKPGAAKPAAEAVPAVPATPPAETKPAAEIKPAAAAKPAEAAPTPTAAPAATP